ncbi:MAG: amidohydrolase family protein, partial [bacterium]
MTDTLFADVAVFDSRKGLLTEPSQVLVKDGLIASITPGSAPPPGSDGATVIQGRGKTLIPGLIDAHWHSMFANIPLSDAMSGDPGYLHVVAGRGATATLLRGFTSVRDAGGPAFGLKRAIDEGVVAGPRIYPSGAFISQ